MAKATRAIPEGYRTVTPGLCIRGADRALEFYQQAFGAQVVMQMRMPNGNIGHAEIKIGDSMVFLSEECSDMPNSPRSPDTLKGATGSLYLYLPDADAAFARALKAGAKTLAPVADMFWGDRCGQVQDPFGHTWWLATHTEDLTPEEIAQRQQAFFASASKA